MGRWVDQPQGTRWSSDVERLPTYVLIRGRGNLYSTLVYLFVTGLLEWCKKGTFGRTFGMWKDDGEFGRENFGPWEWTEVNRRWVRGTTRVTDQGHRPPERRWEPDLATRGTPLRTRAYARRGGGSGPTRAAREFPRGDFGDNRGIGPEGTREKGPSEHGFMNVGPGVMGSFPEEGYENEFRSGRPGITGRMRGGGTGRRERVRGDSPGMDGWTGTGTQEDPWMMVGTKPWGDEKPVPRPGRYRMKEENEVGTSSRGRKPRIRVIFRERNDKALEESVGSN